MPEAIPIPDSTIIWRYMDFVKFAAMLEHQGLFFSRADLLGDPFEGTFTPRSVEFLEQHHKMTKRDAHRWSDVLKALRKNSHLTCWHESDSESAALWRLYGNSIAIRSSYGHLRKFLPEDKYDIKRVEYIDYESDHPDIISSAGALLYKRLAFKHEREVRAICQTFTFEGPRLIPYEHGGFPGYYEEGDLGSLIESIVVAPQTDRWFVELVFKIAQSYKLDVPCSPSTLDTKPPF